MVRAAVAGIHCTAGQFPNSCWSRLSHKGSCTLGTSHPEVVGPLAEDPCELAKESFCNEAPGFHPSPRI